MLFRVMNRKWIALMLPWLFGFIGLGLLAGAAAVAASTWQFVTSASEADGQVIDVTSRRSTEGSGDSSTTYRPVVEWTSPGGERHEFISTVGTNPPSHRKGDRVTVLYEPDQPATARIKGLFSLWFLPTLLGCIGLVFAAIGSALAIPQILARRRRAFLEIHGIRVETKFLDVERNTSISVQGRHPFRIVSQWLDPATGLIHQFRSENIWFDPREFVDVSPIPVWIDPADPRRHHMDISFLPRTA